MFDEKRIEDHSNKSNNNNYINIENDHDVCLNLNNNDDKDVEDEKQTNKNNNQEQNENQQNIVTTEYKINKITENSNYTANEEEEEISQLVLKENDLQLLMDEEMENIDSCSSGTTATTVISAYCLSPNSSLRSTTLLPSSLLTYTSSTSSTSTTTSILTPTIDINTNDNFEFNEDFLDNL